MKLLLPFRLVLLLALSWAAARPALAAVPQAGQLSYTYVSTAANGEQTYRVRAEIIASCGPALPATLALQATQSCGGTPRTATLSQPRAAIAIPGYCPRQQAQAQCPPPAGATTPEGFDQYTYEGTIALPPAATWTLAVEAGPRAATANLLGTSALRLEATLRSLVQPLGGGAPVVITNNSPVFSTVNLSLPLVFPEEQSTVTFAAVDADRTIGRADSLAYTLETPLSGCGVLATYAPYPGSGCVSGIDPRCANRVLACSLPGAAYTATLPIATPLDTVYENGSRIRPLCPGVVAVATIRPGFAFDPATGSFTFISPAVLAGATALGLNKYAVTGKVTEYRKLNGSYYEVGSSRREFVVLVAPRLAPGPSAGRAPVVALPAGVSRANDTLDLTVYTCEYSSFRFRISDPDNAPPLPAFGPQNVTVFHPADVNTNLLQGGALGFLQVLGDGTPTPRVDLRFQPPPTAAGTIVLIPLRLEDDDCPLKKVGFYTLRIQFSARPAPVAVQVAGQPQPYAVVCPGTSVALTGQSLRSDSIVSVVPGQVLRDNFYRWSAAPGYSVATAGLPTRLDTANLRVSPTATTRYLLRVDPRTGFGPGVCTDTASVVVYVVGPAPAISRQGNVLSSSYPAGNQWYFNGTAIAGATGSTYQATATGTYTVVVAAGSGTPCTTPPSPPFQLRMLGSGAALPGTSLTLSPNPSADGRLRVELSGYQHPATLAVYDLLGRPVLAPLTLEPSPAGTVRELDLSRQPAGVYLLQVRTPGGLDMRRVVRQ